MIINYRARHQAKRSTEWGAVLRWMSEPLSGWQQIIMGAFVGAFLGAMIALAIIG